MPNQISNLAINIMDNIEYLIDEESKLAFIRQWLIIAVSSVTYSLPSKNI